MNSEIQIFESIDFGKIRVVVVDDEVWFNLSDICKILELTQPSKVKERLSIKGVRSIPTLTTGGTQNLLYINEPNLYKAIFQSRKPEAEKFSDWVTGEVLPSIRKTGNYSMQKSIPKTFAEALRAYANEIEQRELIEKQRDEAVRTKAWIGAKREATAMNTAVQKAKEVKKLKIELDKSKEYASIRAVEKITGKKYNWRKLRNYCTGKELEMKKIHKDVIIHNETTCEKYIQFCYFYQLSTIYDAADLFFLNTFRRDRRQVFHMAEDFEMDFV